MSDPATAHQQAIIALGNTVKRHALVMGFNDAFAMVDVVLVISGIAILLTGKPKGKLGITLWVLPGHHSYSTWFGLGL